MKQWNLKIVNVVSHAIKIRSICFLLSGLTGPVVRVNNSWDGSGTQRWIGWPCNVVPGAVLGVRLFRQTGHVVRHCLSEARLLRQDTDVFVVNVASDSVIASISAPRILQVLMLRKHGNSFNWSDNMLLFRAVYIMEQIPLPLINHPPPFPFPFLPSLNLFLFSFPFPFPQIN